MHHHSVLAYYMEQELEQERYALEVRRHEREWARGADQRADQIQKLRTLHWGEIPRAEWEVVLEDPRPSDPAQLPSWEARRALTERVLSRDETSYMEALQICRCLAEIAPHFAHDGLTIAVASSCIDVVLLAPASDAMHLPNGMVIALRELAREADHRIYQDYVCGLALRAARDVMSVLLVEDVRVDVMLTFQMRPNDEPIRTRALSVLCTRAAMEAFDWSSCDASDTVEALPHTMKFNPSNGFRSVEQVSR